MAVTTQAPQEDPRFTRRRSIVKPLSLLISVIKEIGGNFEKEISHKHAFKKLMRDQDYEDFRDEVIDEWLRIKYSTALGAAIPLNPAELKRRHVEQQKKRQQVRDEINGMKFKIMGKALELIMPNGKKLGQCTGTDCLRFGGWLSKVGEAVGPTRLVGDVFSENDLAKLAK
jgi:hypothetical protein